MKENLGILLVGFDCLGLEAPVKLPIIGNRVKKNNIDSEKHGLLEDLQQVLDQVEQRPEEDREAQHG